MKSRKLSRLTKAVTGSVRRKIFESPPAYEECLAAANGTSVIRRSPSPSLPLTLPLSLCEDFASLNSTAQSL